MTTKKAQQGERTIQVEVRFFTDTLAKEGHVRPKHAWDAGTVRLEANPTHGIAGGAGGRKFNSLLELLAVIEKVLIAGGIHLHAAHRTKKYLELA